MSLYGWTVPSKVRLTVNEATPLGVVLTLSCPHNSGLCMEQVIDPIHADGRVAAFLLAHAHGEGVTLESPTPDAETALTECLDCGCDAHAQADERDKLMRAVMAGREVLAEWREKGFPTGEAYRRLDTILNAEGLGDA